MNAQVNLSNVYRKVRALLAKTTANGCTADEAASALQAAKDIVTKYAIDPARFDWPKEPVPEVGTESPAKPKRQRTPKTNRPTKVRRGDRLMELMSRDIGVSIAELMGEFNVLEHTARAYISIETRKRGVKPVLKDKRYYLPD